MVVDSSLRLTAGGERGLLKGERGRFFIGDFAMTTADSCKLLTGMTVYRDNALEKRQAPKLCSFGSQISRNARLGFGYSMVSQHLLPASAIIFSALDMTRSHMSARQQLNIPPQTALK